MALGLGLFAADDRVLSSPPAANLRDPAGNGRDHLVLEPEPLVRIWTRLRCEGAADTPIVCPTRLPLFTVALRACLFGLVEILRPVGCDTALCVREIHRSIAHLLR